MKRKLITIIASAALSLSMAFSSFAGCWYDDGSYPTNTWLWVQDGEKDYYKHYYFNQDGYLLKNSTAPNGSSVNEKGEQLLNGSPRNAYFRVDNNSNKFAYVLNYGSVPTQKIPAGSMGYGEQSICNIVLDLLSHPRLEEISKYEPFMTSYEISRFERPGQFASVYTTYKDIPYSVIYYADSRIADPTGKINYTPLSVNYIGSNFREVFPDFPSASDGISCASLLKQKGYSILVSDQSRVDFTAGKYTLSVSFSSDGKTTGTIGITSKVNDGIWPVS